MNNFDDTEKTPKKSISENIKEKYNEKYSVYKNHKDFSKRGIIKIISLVLAVVLVVLCFNNGETYRITYAKNKLYNKYLSNYAYTESVKLFRQELTPEEELRDYDGDGLTNIEEKNNNTDIYRYDSDFDGIDDYHASKTISDGASVFKEVTNSIDDTSSKQASRVLTANIDICDDYSNKAVTMRYNGAAFSNLKGLFVPFVIYNYKGRIEIESKKLNKYDDVYVLYYNPKDDTYTSVNRYIGSGYNNNYVSVEVEDGQPMLIYARFEEYNTSRSLDISVLNNRYGSDNNLAVTVKNGKASKITFFDYDNLLNPSNSEVILDRFADKCNVKLEYAGEEKREEIKKYKYYQSCLKNGQKPENISLSEKLKFNIINMSGANVRYGDVNISKAVVLSNKHSDSTDEKIYGNVVTKSKGYKFIYDTKFRPEVNGFSFANKATAFCENGLSFAMAETVSNYYNYSKVPCLINDENKLASIVNNELHANGIHSTNFTEEVEGKNHIRIYDLKNDNIKNYLEEKTQQNYSNYFSKNDDYNYSLGLINNLAEKLKNGKTVVAYMRNGDKATAVVVYSIKQSAYDPNEYVLNVYDPNFPDGKIVTYDEETGEPKSLKVNMDLYLHVKPYIAYNYKTKKLYCSGKFTFDYGNGFDYSFGNSKKIKNGTVYVGGEIFFKDLCDYSKTTDNFYLLGQKK